MVLLHPGDEEHFSDSTIAKEQYTLTRVSIQIISTPCQWKIIESARTKRWVCAEHTWTRESGGSSSLKIRYSEITCNAIIGLKIMPEFQFHKHFVRKLYRFNHVGIVFTWVGLETTSCLLTPLELHAYALVHLTDMVFTHSNTASCGSIKSV